MRNRICLIAASLLVAACHPGNKEAKRLRGACASGDVAACNSLAVRLSKGEYVLRDESHAAELFDQACKGNVGDGCASLGLAYQKGTGVKRDSARALALFKQGCDMRGLAGCTSLGLVYRAALHRALGRILFGLRVRR